MARGALYYRGIRGSAALATAPLHDEVAAEALEPGELRRVPFAGELLGAVRVRGDYAALPLDAFDRTSAVLEAEEQAAYLQLLRLAVGEGRNWCRAGKRELMTRLRLSERRLNRVLDALVAHRFIRPLHRDNRGTLWRVYLPREAFGEPVGEEVLLGRAAPVAAPAAAVPRASRPAVAARRAGGSREAELARALAAARGSVTPDSLALAAREVRELMDEGQSPDRIAACIDVVARRAAREGIEAGLKGTP